MVELGEKEGKQREFVLRLRDMKGNGTSDRVVGEFSVTGVWRKSMKTSAVQYTFLQ